MTPDRFVILSLPRSGSTTFARMLNSHQDISCLIEPFHPLRYRGTFHQYAVRHSVPAALEVIRARWNGIKHVWESSGWPFLARPELNEQVVAGPGAKVLLLIRRNFFRRVVSNLLSRQTRYWMGTRTEFLSHLDSVRLMPLNPDLVLRQIRNDQKAITDRLQSLADHDTPVMRVYHEELFRENADITERLQLVNAVLDFLGFTAITPEVFARGLHHHFDPDVNRWSSPEVYRRIPGIESVEKQIGCDETGWLFR